MARANLLFLCFLLNPTVSNRHQMTSGTHTIMKLKHDQKDCSALFANASVLPPHRILVNVYVRVVCVCVRARVRGVCMYIVSNDLITRGSALHQKDQCQIEHKHHHHRRN